MELFKVRYLVTKLILLRMADAYLGNYFASYLSLSYPLPPMCVLRVIRVNQSSFSECNIEGRYKGWEINCKWCFKTWK
jgi:hypothetical protein